MFLEQIDPTPEQRKILFLPPNQPVLISGRAGSGKTTTAILRAAHIARFYEKQRGISSKIGIFVFNKTLDNYLSSLVKALFPENECDVQVFDYWCRTFLNENDLLEYSIANEEDCLECLREAIEAVNLGSRAPDLMRFGEEFLIDEINYLIGRFGFDAAKYLETERIGRGQFPYIDFDTKSAIAQELIPAYQLSLESRNRVDWNSLREQTLSFMRAGLPFQKYDVLVVDEAQDLTALQIKIALEIVSPETNSITFIRDSTQRIYKNDYVWQDVELDFGTNSTLDLKKNYRNTYQVASVASSLMSSIGDMEEDFEEDIDVLQPELTVKSGNKPTWVRGRYTHQKNYVVQCLKEIDTHAETVGILHIRGSDTILLRRYLQLSGFPCTVLRDEENLTNKPGGIYISTLHSAKGLEFDHLFIVGYEDFFSPGRDSLRHRETTAHLISHLKLLYTAVTRAKKDLIITSSKDKYSRFLKCIDPSLLNIVDI